MLHIKNISDEITSFICLEKQPQSALKMLNMQTMRSSIFGGKTTRAYCSLWTGVVGFVLVLDHDSHRRCCLWNEVMLTEEVPPLATGFCNASSLYKWHIRFHSSPRRGRWFLTLDHQGMRPPYIFCLKSFLQKPFVKELAEKERFAQVTGLPSTISYF